MRREPAVFVGPECGNQFASLDRGDNGHIAGKGLVAPNMVIVIVTVDQRGHRPGGQCWDRLSKSYGCCQRNEGVENEDPVSQVNNSRVTLGRATFPVNCCKDPICQLVKLEMCRSERTHSS